ncbi:hypothetical protein ACIGBN_16970 [Marinomonas sp. NPDC078689]|uniref:hypothetical protein n=1 Tax=Marinomonas sp. NPDC078689 TaxID=3364147 RepID=UPI0037C5945F
MKDEKVVVPKFVLHVGRHKTGTTSVQHFLALNEDLLSKKYGILYPRIGRHKRNNNHHSFFLPFITTGKPIDPTDVSLMMEEAVARRCHTVLLSSEVLSRPNLSDDQLQAIRAVFSGYEVEVIMSLRRQDDFQESRYAERVKKGLIGFSETIEDIEAESLDYYGFVGRYAAIFGREAITITSYDRDKREGLLVRFLSILGIPSFDGFQTRKQSLNARYSWRYIEFIRRVNRYKLGRFIVTQKAFRVVGSRLSTYLSKWFPRFMNQPKPISAEEKKALFAEYKASNERLENEYLNGERLF